MTLDLIKFNVLTFSPEIIESHSVNREIELDKAFENGKAPDINFDDINDSSLILTTFINYNMLQHLDVLSSSYPILRRDRNGVEKDIKVCSLLFRDGDHSLDLQNVVGSAMEVSEYIHSEIAKRENLKS